MRNKMIVVCQRDAKDCGPCALQSIIRFYNGYVSIEKIRQDAYTSKEGTTVYHLIKAANNYGFDAIAKKHPDKKINNVCLPIIAHVSYENGLQHFVCVYEIKNDKYIIMDPAKGKIIMSKENFNQIFTGIFIELYPQSKIVKFDKESSIYSLFLNIIKKNKNLCINLLLCSILLTLFTIISSFYFKYGYETLQNNNFQFKIKYMIYLFSVVTVLKVVTNYIKNYYENHLNKNIDVGIFSKFINHIFSLPLKVINTRSSGEIISRINELNSIKELFSKLFVSSFLDLIMAICSIIILFYINNILGGILVGLIIVYVIFTLLINPHLYKRIKNNIDYHTEVNSTIIENIDMIDSLKNLNKTSFALDKIENKMSNYLYDNYTFANELNITNFFQESIYEIGIFLVNTCGFFLIYNDKLSMINLIVFNTLMYYFINPIRNIMALIPKYNFLRASFNKICDFIDLDEEKVGIIEPFNNGEIIFDNVSFSYNSYHSNIKNFSLKIKENQSVMIKGKSGSGKSTLCKLLQGLYKCDDGQILINNKNILDYSILSLRENITYVGQKEKMFSDTIKNNITFYDNKEDLFNEVCNICLIEDIVKKKTFRYNYRIDSSLGNLSGGEKQRIILARALMKNSKILIVDEALSEVDYKLEKQIINNIKMKYPNKTLIYITHKFQDNLFDKVIDLEKRYE